ncbi:MAG: divergent polysaccharide deacetylase family protein [Kiloniellales bacterium]
MLAWLIVIGTVVAAVGYVYLVPEETVTAGAAGTQPATPEPSGVAAPEPPPAEVEPPQDQPETAPPTQTAEAEATPEPEAKLEPEPEPEPEPEATETAATPPPEPPSPPPEPPSPPPAAPQAEPVEPAAEQTAALPPAPSLEGMPLWRRNSQPFDARDERPRIAVVLTGLGLSSAATEAAIKQLPPAITLSFTPYSRKLNQWVALARVNGHEVMLDLPMEPTSYPNDDPGPQALLTALSARQNLDRLRWTLDRTTGYVGVATIMGSRFTASENHLEPILTALKNRGLLFLDNRSSDQSVAGQLATRIGVPLAINDRALDRPQASRVAIDARLVQLEGIALAGGVAVAMGRPYPVTIERLREWTREVESRGFVLAPISAVADRQPMPITVQRTAPSE